MLSVAAVTLKGTPADVIEPMLAVMLVVPTDAEVTRPFEPEALLTVATAGTLDVQVAWPVITCTVPSVYVPAAINACEVPSAVVGAAGVTAIDTSVAVVTSRVADDVKFPQTAAIRQVTVSVVRPGAWLFARPLLSTAATTVFDDDQLT